MQEFLATLKNPQGELYAEIVFFRDEDTAWRWVESRKDSNRPPVFIEPLNMSARWTGIHS
jgi:hypothetical protein